MSRSFARCRAFALALTLFACSAHLPAQASMPRLREMLASQGFQLMDSSVSHGFARQTRHESAGTPRVDSLGEAPTTSAAAIRITGLLDLYA